MLRRIVAHADGWLPNRITPAEVETSRGQLDAMAKEAGRDPKSITISVYGQPPDRALVQALLNAGADRVVVRPEHVETEAEMGRQLEAWQKRCCGRSISQRGTVSTPACTYCRGLVLFAVEQLMDSDQWPVGAVGNGLSETGGHGLRPAGDRPGCLRQNYQNRHLIWLGAQTTILNRHQSRTVVGAPELGADEAELLDQGRELCIAEPADEFVLPPGDGSQANGQASGTIAAADTVHHIARRAVGVAKVRQDASGPGRAGWPAPDRPGLPTAALSVTKYVKKYLGAPETVR